MLLSRWISKERFRFLQTKKKSILIKYRVHVRELSKCKMASFRCVSTKIPPTFPILSGRKRLFRSWQARMPSGRKLQRFEAKRVARFTFVSVASWNTPRPVIIVARSGAKASRGPETMSTGRNNKVEGKSSWNSSSYLENVHLVSRGQKRKRKEVWKKQRRLIYIRTRYRNINIPVGSMLGL